MSTKNALIRREEMNLRSDIVYLNHAAIGPWTKKGYEIYCEKSKLMAENGEFGGDIDVANEEYKNIQIKFGKLINASENEIALTTSTSDGLRHVATGLNMSSLSGKNLVINRLEFVANSFVWQQLANQMRMEIRVIPSNQERIFVDDYRNYIDENTELVIASSVQFSNGYRINVKELVELSHSKGAKVMIDAIQHIGNMKFDFHNYEIDFLALGCYKWLLCPMNTGMFVVRNDLIEKLDPISITWYGDEDFNDMKYRPFKPYRDGRKFTTLSKLNPSLWSISETLNTHLDWANYNVEEYLINLTDYLVDKLSELDGFKLVSPRENRDEKSAIVTFTHFKPLDQLVNYLKENKIIVALRAGNIRISPHCYNTKQDIDILAEEIAKWNKSS